MRVIALGVNGAFSTGQYQKAIPTDKLRTLLADAKGKNPDVLLHQLDKLEEAVYQPAWQSNFLLEFDMPNKRGKKGEPYRLLVDCGCDARHALAGTRLSFADLDGVYISHPHSDHIGGLEGFALTTIFNPFYTAKKKEWLGDKFIIDRLIPYDESPFPPSFAKPDLFVHPKVLVELRTALQPGLDTMQGVPFVKLETYFNIVPIGRNAEGVRVTYEFHDRERTWKMTPVFAMHVVSASEEMPSYGISLEDSDGKFVLFPTDTQHMMPPQLAALYRRAEVIYMDCETSPFPSGVHPHVSDLIERMEPEIQKKCFLYHYQGEPKVPDGMFKGVLKTGDVHEY